MQNKTLEQVQERLEHVRARMELFFKSLNTPDNLFIKKDRFWGQRTINLYIRLDEFSIEEFEKLLPELRSMVEEFRQLRAIEKDKTDAALIERRILQDTMGDFIRPTGTGRLSSK